MDKVKKWPLSKVFRYLTFLDLMDKEMAKELKVPSKKKMHMFQFKKVK